MANSRVRRSRETEDLTATYFRLRGGAREARRVDNFLPGKDILGVPGVSIEVKATSDGSLPAFLRQAEAQATVLEVPVVVWRPNGYGPERIDDWVFATRLEDGVELLKMAGVL